MIGQFASHLLFSVLIHIAFATVLNPAAPMKGRPLDSTKDMTAVFGNKTFSFDVEDNWEICMRGAARNLPHFDGVDYTELLRVSLKAASNAGGGAVKLEEGTYIVSGPIEIPSHTCVIGVDMGKTTVKLADDSEAFYEKGMFYSRKGERISLQAFTIDGNKANQRKPDSSDHNGVYFESIDYAWLRNVGARNMLGYGFDMHGSENRWAFHLLFEGSISVDNDKDGFNIGQTYYSSVAYSRSAKNGRHGIHINQGSKYALIKRTEIEGKGKRSKACSIMIQRTDNLKPSNVRVQDTQISNPSLAAICVYSAKNVNVEGVTVTGSNNGGSYCFDIAKVQGFSAENNQCTLSPEIAQAGSCSNGVVFKDICCPVQCGTCGGPGCSDRKADKVCCVSTIRAANKTCDNSAPPCIIAKK